MGRCATVKPLVLHIVHSVSPGGTERVLASLTAALSRRGTRHAVCALRRLGRLSDTFDSSVNVFTLGARGADRLLFRRLARVIASLKPAIVHARNWGTWTDAALAVRSAPRSAPPTRLLLGFQGLQQGTGFNRLQRVRALALGFRRLPAATVSQAARDVLVRDLGCDADRVTVIGNGVDLDHFHRPDAARRAEARRRFGVSPDDFVIVSTGALKPVKRHELMIRSLSGVIQRHHATRLLLAGYGTTKPQLERLVRSMGLEAHVRFVGWIDDVRDVLSCADAYLCASRFEGMSNSLIEAMATGLACVVTDVSDHRAMFASVDPEAVVAVDDVSAMTDRLLRLANAPSLRARVARRARRYIESAHDFQATVDGYDRLYHRLIGSSSPRSRPPGGSARRKIAPA